eukprot:SAG11_NODE_1005_length_6207_cov_6.145499_4_plen_417_part_00
MTCITRGDTDKDQTALMMNASSTRVDGGCMRECTNWLRDRPRGGSAASVGACGDNSNTTLMIVVALVVGLLAIYAFMAARKVAARKVAAEKRATPVLELTPSRARTCDTIRANRIASNMVQSDVTQLANAPMADDCRKSITPQSQRAKAAAIAAGRSLDYVQTVVTEHLFKIELDPATGATTDVEHATDFVENAAEAAELAQRMIDFHQQCAEQLSQQRHYGTFGASATARAVASAAKIVMASPDQIWPRTDALRRALIESTVPKFTLKRAALSKKSVNELLVIRRVQRRDYPTFMALLDQYFPSTCVRSKLDNKGFLSPIRSFLRSHPAKVKAAFDAAREEACAAEQARCAHWKLVTAEVCQLAKRKMAKATKAANVLAHRERRLKRRLQYLLQSRLRRDLLFLKTRGSSVRFLP